MKILVTGISGRMGQEVVKAAASEENVTVVAGLSRSAKTVEKGPPVFTSFKEVNGVDVDVVVDFALPELLLSTIEWCEKNSVPLVSGTTGLDDELREALRKVSQKISVLWSPNMSLGIAWMQSMIKQFSQLKGFDFQIEEFHHRHKKDSPSGTAKYLQEELLKSVDARAPEPVAVRGGGIFGIHTLYAMSEEETLSLQHTALNRSVFAKGAVQAAKWLASQKPGFYSLNDVLNG